MPHVAFITSVAPTGPAEAFVLEEIAFLRTSGVRVTVAPVRLDGPIFHGTGQQLAEDSLLWPLLDGSSLAALARTAARRPARLIRILFSLARSSGSPRRALKNLAALPKACRLADASMQRGVTHVHATWASVPASVAWMIGRLTGIPWSFCAIRWDIAEANLLGPKFAEAAFIRATSDGAAKELLAVAGVGGQLARKVVMIRHGVPLPPMLRPRPRRPAPLRIVSAGFFVPKKGLRYLVEACGLLRDRGLPFECRLIGAGPLEADLRRRIKALRLERDVVITGHLPQSELFALFESGEIDVLAHPSIVAADGQREGTPVTLMDALAHGLPVVSTPTGDIPEVLGGIPESLVPPADAGALAERFAQFAANDELLPGIARSGRAVVEKLFDIRQNIGARLRRSLTG